jgi:glycosyltransferase involved in cell wall biosynthesis
MEIFYNKLLPVVAKTEKVALITTCAKIKVNAYRIFRIPKKIVSIPGSTRFATLFFTAVTLIKIRKYIKIVHLPYTSNGGRWGFVMPLLKKVFGVRYLLYIHGGGMKPWRWFNADKSLFKNASKIVAVSKIIKNEYESRSAREIEVIYPLVPFEETAEKAESIRKKLNFTAQDKILLFVGSLKKLKAPDIVLKAFISLGSDFISKQKLKLIFVGEGNLKDKLLAEVKEKGLEPFVSFTGKIPYEYVPEYYKISNIYIISSQFEGTPKTLLEAMFNKVPVIASDVRGINNIVAHERQALLFKQDDSGQLKENLRQLIGNNSLQNKLVEAAWQSYSEAFSFSKTVEQLLKIYQMEQA